jgi:putative transposase
MDSKGRWVENALVERLRRSVKYEALYLHARDTPSEANMILERYFGFCNVREPRRGLGDLKPDEVYLGKTEVRQAA